MRTRRLLAAAALAAAAAALAQGDASATGLPRFPRPFRAGKPTALQQVPAVFQSGPATCDINITPGLIPEDLAASIVTKVADVLGATFDPSDFDEISVAGDGGLLAYATTFSPEGLPGSAKAVVLLTVGPQSAPVAIPRVAAENDQPQVQFDDFGFRCVFRSSAGAGGVAPTNIQIHGVRRGAAAAAPETIAITALTGAERAFDPALAARTRVREIDAGVTVRERDARVAFVSDADLDAGGNPQHDEQLFLWEEADKRFRQLTDNQKAGQDVVNRPSINKLGDAVVFESTADLDPESRDPSNTSRKGNPSGKRNLFRWRAGRGLEQITWVTDGNCFSPRMDINGRFVLFSTDGDPIAGGNGEHNREIFRWTAATQRLEQLTATTGGDSVLPRPTLSPNSFVFWSTSHLAGGTDTLPRIDGVNVPRGPADHECGPAAMLYENGRVVFVHGFSDQQNAYRGVVARPGEGPPSTLQKTPIVTGPPACGASARTVFFGTNDYRLTKKPGRLSTQPLDESLPAFLIAFAGRRPGR